MTIVFARLFADTALVALLLFSTAGTVSWGRAWVLLAVLLVVRVAGAVVVARVNPKLLRERAQLPVHATQPLTDRLLLLGVLATGFLGLPVLAGLDVFRWQLLPAPPPVVSALGLTLFALGWSVKQLALWANAFATTAVRIQGAQTVADTGVYAVVRHPFYAADPLIFVGLSLWLASYASAVAAVLPVALMIVRLHFEEHFLHRTLPEYGDYTRRVPYRLIPGLW